MYQGNGTEEKAFKKRKVFKEQQRNQQLQNVCRQVPRQEMLCSKEEEEEEEDNEINKCKMHAVGYQDRKRSVQKEKKKKRKSSAKCIPSVTKTGNALFRRKRRRRRRGNQVQNACRQLPRQEMLCSEGKEEEEEEIKCRRHAVSYQDRKFSVQKEKKKKKKKLSAKCMPSVTKTGNALFRRKRRRRKRGNQVQNACRQLPRQEMLCSEGKEEEKEEIKCRMHAVSYQDRRFPVH